MLGAGMPSTRVWGGCGVWPPQGWKAGLSRSAEQWAAGSEGAQNLESPTFVQQFSD